jgi:hypothetical protein
MAEDSAGPEGAFAQRLRRELGLDAAEPDAVEHAAGLVRTCQATKNGSAKGLSNTAEAVRMPWAIVH